MAARAHDVAALCLRGEDAHLNFPDSVHTLPRPERLSPKCIQEAATSAAMSFQDRLLPYTAPQQQQQEQEEQPDQTERHEEQQNSQQPAKVVKLEVSSSPGSRSKLSSDHHRHSSQIQTAASDATAAAAGASPQTFEYVDEDFIFNMPTILSSMAEALAVPLPPPPQDDRDDNEENAEDGTIWDPSTWDRYS
ncbi:dehydration-responsive element-binding protein 1D isoform X1 [Selaginella moellendorffii]|uniref:dehydration-responsive element-binding protein 1D isoform X1 n=1 Tax=Selaginella moellendorffii TaxID=88036 RepID=UPI000D1C8EB4|nr:dehydration-responsive element-binding protein 1D isoform X1 [Selaginella moellendorffii]|eukprot:XP_024520607.1 dehydration-responsive element-binding protein 1D isoform X1 [Selaginella moellendorffii]